MQENEIGKEVVDAEVKIHSALGPGLLETVYEVVLARELEQRGLAVARQVAVPIGLDNENLGVFGSLRETRMNGQPESGANSVPLRSTE
jgi:hypothetical protein